QQLRQKRRQTLDRYDLSSVFEDIQKRLDEILSLEKDTLGRRLDEAGKQIEGESGLDAFNEALKPTGQEPTAEEQKRLGEMLKNITEKKQNLLEELIEQMQAGIAAMQSLLDSLPPDMRRQLQDLLMERVTDSELQRELQELAINLDIVSPHDMQNQYPFRGDEELDLLQAMDLMG